MIVFWNILRSYQKELADLVNLSQKMRHVSQCF